MRLADGQVGRVQSLGSGLPAAGNLQTGGVQNGEIEPTRATSAGGSGRLRGLQQDVRSDGHDPAALPDMGSLGDYIKAPRKQKRKVAAGYTADASRTGDDVRKQLEVEFANLDSTLIAAIVADHGNIEGAREVLKSLS